MTQVYHNYNIQILLHVNYMYFTYLLLIYGIFYYM